MILRALVVDDEKPNRELLIRMVEKACSSITIIAEASSVPDAVTMIREHKPELVFLDVEMPELSGFNLFDYFEKPEFQVVFVTAHEHYALGAIKKNALDYLLKPVDLVDLVKVEKKILEQRSRIESDALGYKENRQNFDDLKEFIKASRNDDDKKLFVPTLGGFRLIPVRKIQYVEAKGSYSQIKLTDSGEILVTKQIGDLESELEKHDFFRCHKSYLINLHVVESYHQSDGGNCITIYGQIIPVARRKYTGFVERLLDVVGALKHLS
jgi:two-component system, LytTR family, response regulator